MKLNIVSRSYTLTQKILHHKTLEIKPHHTNNGESLHSNGSLLMLSCIDAFVIYLYVENVFVLTLYRNLTLDYF